MNNRFLFISFFLAVTIAAGCNSFPKDAEHTLQKISGNNIKVGVTISATAGDTALVKGFADDINAAIVWVPGDQHYLAEALSEYSIDIAIGGFKKNNPLKKLAAFTKPYRKAGKNKYVIAIPKGENALLMKLEQYIDTHGTE